MILSELNILAPPPRGKIRQKWLRENKKEYFCVQKSRAVDPHSFFADPDPAVFLNADPDPGGKMNADPDPAEQICKK